MFALNLLGGAALEGRGGPVTGRAAHRRRLALLAILAAARGRMVARERILGLLWAEHGGSRARHLLSESLYVLRKELGESAFLAAGDEVGLNGEVVASDVAGFEGAVEEGDLEGAARLYRGPFLDGFYVADAPEFERWAEAERDRLARIFTRALESLAGAREGEGRPQEAAEWWRRLAVHDPYNSRVASRLMLALDASGERAAALWFADTHTALLREELGVEPEREFADVVERLKTEPVRLPPAPPPPLPPASAPPEAEAEAEAVPEPASPVPAPEPESGPEPAPELPSEPEADPEPESGVEPEPVVEPGIGIEPEPDPGLSAPAPALVPSPPPAPDWAAEVPAPVSVTEEAPVPVAAAAGGAERRSRWRRRTALMGMVGLMAAALGLLTSGRDDASPPRAEGYDPHRIAVLYFDDHSRGGELGYLASGLTEMLIHELSQVRALDIVSRNGVKPYRDASVQFDSMVADLRVGSVVEGSLQRSGDSVRLTVQFIDASSGSHLESRTLVHPMADVFTMEDTLARMVAGFLRHRLGEEVRLRRTRAGTRSSEALRLVYRATEARDDAARLGLRPGPAGDPDARAPLLGRADSLLAEAERADPGWTHPTLERGWVAYDASGLAGGAGARERLRAAEAYARRVLAREPRNARALELRGAVALRWVTTDAPGAGGVEGARMASAEADLRAAVAADSSLAGAWARLGTVLLYRGAFAESSLAAGRALDEDAYLEDADDVVYGLYLSALMLGSHREAWTQCGHGRDRFPADYRFLECRLTLLREDRSRPASPDEAWRLVAALDRLDPPARARAEGRGYSPVYRRMLAAAVLARAGQGDSARAVLARAHGEVGSSEERRLDLGYDEAYVLLLLGDRGSARARLAHVVARRPWLEEFARRDPLLRELFPLTPAATPPAAADSGREGGGSPRP